MTRLMYDAINASNLPAGGDLYAGYVDGKWSDANAISERFPHATVARIATSPSTDNGVIGDGPPDNGTWPEWVQWVVRRRASGLDPTMNTNLSNWAAGKAAFKAAQVAEPHWWIASYDGDPAIPAGAIAKQYASSDAYDTSSVAAYWPGVDPAPKAPAPPAPALEEDTMLILSVPTSADAPTGPLSPARWLYNGTQLIALQDGADVTGLTAAGIKSAEVSLRLIEHIAARLGVAVNAL